MDKRLFTVAETAAYMGISKGHIYNMLSQLTKGSTGGLPVRPVFIPGKARKRPGVRFDKFSLDRWIDSQSDRKKEVVTKKRNKKS